MKKYIIPSYFVIEANTPDDAIVAACSMQQAANDSVESIRKTGAERFLLIDENRPIKEGSVGIIVSQ